MLLLRGQPFVVV